MRRNWILASSLGLASTMMLTTAHVSADTTQNDGRGKPENANENTLDASQQTTSQDVYSDNKTVTNSGIPGVPVTDNTITVDDLKDVDLNNYWKQSADVSEATSAGGHTNWANNGSNSSSAKVTSFKFNTFESGHEYYFTDYQRIGYDISFDVDASKLKSGNLIHLFRLTDVSDTGYRPLIQEDNTDTPMMWHGVNIGTIKSTFKFIDIGKPGINWPVEYVDYDFLPNDNYQGVGTQHIDAHIVWNNTFNYNTPYIWRGAPDVNHIKFVVTNNGFTNETPIG